MKLNDDEIRSLIITDYIDSEDLSINKRIGDNLRILKEYGKSSVFTCSDAPEYNPYSKHRLFSKFMCDNNPTIKKYFDFESVYEDDEEAFISINGNDNILKYRGFLLPYGIYYAQVDDDGENFAVLSIDQGSNHDEYYKPISSSLYFIGSKHIKYAKKLKKILNKFKNLEKSNKREVVMKKSNGRNDYKKDTFKPFDKVIFEDKENILHYIDNWLLSLPNYEKYGITPKLSFLLYGKPGTGKSTFAKALANYLDIDTVAIIDNAALMEGISIFRPVVLLIDDIDCIGSSRENNDDGKNKELIASLLEFLDTPPTFNLKGKDGKFYKVSIVVSTTNYYDKLDDAVKRFGRFDKTIEMKDFKLPEIEKMCDLYDVKPGDIIDESNLSSKFTISPAELQAKCIEFVNSKLKELEEKNVEKEETRKRSKKKHKNFKKR